MAAYPSIPTGVAPPARGDGKHLGDARKNVMRRGSVHRSAQVAGPSAGREGSPAGGGVQKGNLGAFTRPMA